MVLLLQELGRLNTCIAHDGELVRFLSLARFLSPSGQFERLSLGLNFDAGFFGGL